MTSPRPEEMLASLRVFHAVLEGYADDVLQRVGGRLVPSFARIHEAMKRHRIERGEATRFVEQLLGLTLERDDYELGAAFCAGVVERAGPEALNRLWTAPSMVPTKSELEAPGTGSSGASSGGTSRGSRPTPRSAASPSRRRSRTPRPRTSSSRPCPSACP